MVFTDIFKNLDYLLWAIFLYLHIALTLVLPTFFTISQWPLNWPLSINAGCSFSLSHKTARVIFSECNSMLFPCLNHFYGNNHSSVGLIFAFSSDFTSRHSVFLLWILPYSLHPQGLCIRYLFFMTCPLTSPSITSLLTYLTVSIWPLGLSSQFSASGKFPWYHPMVLQTYLVELCALLALMTLSLMTVYPRNTVSCMRKTRDHVHIGHHCIVYI